MLTLVALAGLSKTKCVLDLRLPICVATSDEARHNERLPTHRDGKEGGELWKNETRKRVVSTATARVRQDGPSPPSKKIRERKRWKSEAEHWRNGWIVHVHNSGQHMNREFTTTFKSNDDTPLREKVGIYFDTASVVLNRVTSYQTSFALAYRRWSRPMFITWVPRILYLLHLGWFDPWLPRKFFRCGVRLEFLERFALFPLSRVTRAKLYLSGNILGPIAILLGGIIIFVPTKKRLFPPPLLLLWSLCPVFLRGPTILGYSPSTLLMLLSPPSLRVLFSLRMQFLT